MIVYFSGTGNSRYCAEAFAQALRDEMLDCFSLLRKKQPPVLHSERAWVFITPTYAWQIPHLFRDLLRSGSFTGSREAYFVLTCGDDVGNAGARLAKLCAKKGLHYRGILEVVMPENYIAMFRVPKPATQLKIIAAAQPALESGIRCIQEGIPFAPYRATLTQKLKTAIVNPVFYKVCVSAKPFYATDECIGCGRCAQLCVCNNIRMENGKPVWGKDCTHCMACICRCPQQAIEYGSKSQGKPRYFCPPYK